MILYDHVYIYSDQSDPVRYVNLDLLGCNGRPETQFYHLEIRSGKYSITHKKIPFDPTDLHQVYEIRQVPDRKNILKAFSKQFPKK
ncbi:MAG: hypothetical protein RBG13Loki_2347 [Promethearchaeota archaeon CR_4]|nr:MAG: hypothetical protein RBG13Loki_2347 [Candidatus Lokiarchaeota archaeon CR_4]